MKSQKSATNRIVEFNNLCQAESSVEWHPLQCSVPYLYVCENKISHYSSLLQHTSMTNPPILMSNNIIKDSSNNLNSTTLLENIMKKLLNDVV